MCSDERVHSLPTELNLSSGRSGVWCFPPAQLVDLASFMSTQVNVILEEGASTEEKLLPDWPGGEDQFTVGSTSTPGQMLLDGKKAD